MLERLKLLSVARCAHLSYETVGTGEPIGIEQAERIHNQLMNSDVLHASPLEHQCTPDTTWLSDDPTWCNPNEHGNLVGWRQLRRQFPEGRS